MKASQIRENARTALTGKWGKGALITLAYLVFDFAMNFVIGLFGEESLIGGILDLASIIIQVPIVFGLSYAFIKLKRNEEVSAFDFLELGFSNFKRAWKISLRELLKLILPASGIIVGITILGVAIFNAASTSILGTSVEPSTGLMLVGTIICIASLICMTVISLYYSLTTCIAYDKPNMSSLEVINESKRMMTGNRGKIFLLDLSFIGWIILVAFTLGIGYLWLLPYMQIALVCFYENLLEKDQNNNVENNTDTITEY